MSGVVKGVKKAFKTVGKVLKKIWKPLLIAAAVYFTAGAALGWFGAAGGAGAAAGGAASAGFGSSAAAAATAAGTVGTAAGSAAAMTAASAVTGSVGFASTAAAAGSVAAGTYTATALNLALGKGNVSTVGQSFMQAGGGVTPTITPTVTNPSLLSRVGGIIGKMDGYERVMWAQTIISGAAGLAAPKPPSLADQARFQGSFFGVDSASKKPSTYDPGAQYAEMFAPRPGENFRGMMPDRDYAAVPPPPPGGSATATANPPPPPTARSRVRDQEPPNFIADQDDESQNGPNAGYYGPDDFYT